MGEFVKRLLVFVFAIMPFLAFATDEICPAGYQPTEYVELEYIESTGTQYIDTEYQLTSVKERMIAEVALTSSGGDNMIFGAVNDGKNTNINLYSGTLYYRFGGVSLSSVSTDTTQRHKYELGQNSYVDGNLIYAFNNVTSVSDVSLYLFAANVNSVARYHMRGKIYSFQIYDEDTLKLNMIPVLRVSDKAIGMYDKFDGKFYGNDGTGKFIAGPEKLDKKYIVSDNITCVMCPPNTYKSNAGNTQCTECPENTFSPIGSTQLSDCAKILRVKDYIVYMPLGKRTEHGLCVMADNKKYCADVYERQ